MKFTIKKKHNLFSPLKKQSDHILIYSLLLIVIYIYRPAN